MELELKIKAVISKESQKQLQEDIQRVLNRERNNKKDAKFLLLELYLQIGIPDTGNKNALDYQNKDNIVIYLQSKIKNYIFFNSKESLDLFIESQFNNDKDLYLIVPIEMGCINISYKDNRNADTIAKEVFEYMNNELKKSKGAI